MRPIPDCTSSTTSRIPCLREQLAQPLQELIGRDDVAAFALDGLDDERRDFVGRDELLKELVLDVAEAFRDVRAPASGRRDGDSIYGYGA